MNNYNKTLFDKIVALQPVVWINSKKQGAEEALSAMDITYEDILDAEKRLQRFAPLIKKLFPETDDGIIESPLVEIPYMKEEVQKTYGRDIKGTMYLKCDSHLKVAGSIKARGGIYEVLKYAEGIAINKGLLEIGDDYSKLADKEFKDFFSAYKIAVGSTGNLGLSIGIISAAMGFNVTVHMSRDAKAWKKRLLREKGANVIEYADDYSKAVEEGRKQCMGDDHAHFVDDENSKDLFLGYSVAALRLKKQLEDVGVKVDESHQLIVYLPCGVGGAPGGISFGLKHVFSDNVKCYFVEPTHAPCMLLGLITEKKSDMHIREYGIDNLTEADGLAVGSPSKLVSDLAEKLIDGVYTLHDDELFKLLAMLKDTQDIKIEPSAASSLLGPAVVGTDKNTTHICWATGGSFVPSDLYLDMYQRGKEYY
ncbi:D-serine dehydratase DsdA [Clostridium aceticum]|uniref:Probable D-serine dehydratase n=1 Tax=Clostridium aceticum TaxID=84022 RepID=A0A0D8I845_9CLOT|nr:D-serine ammonia-lyase [Clostridium aceticum]AKL94660.1 D-serine dehydratase DsdA [Clostridium aceticum]KJF26445.1 serine ammonia-lyase [Clostridium aceticum]